MNKLKILILFFFLGVIQCSAQHVGERPGYNFYPAIENGKYGYINSTGQWMINPKFDWCDYFFDGRAIAKEKGKYGYINVKGEWVGKPVYDSAKHFNEGLAAISMQSDNGEFYWSYIDTAGIGLNLNVPALSNLSTFNNGRAIGSEANFLSFYFFNRKLEIAFKENGFYLDENKIPEFSENMLHVFVGQGFSSFIDTSGNLWNKGQFENCGDFHEGIAWVQSNIKYGYINMNGEIIIPAEYDSAGNFSEGIALVKTGMEYSPNQMKLFGGLVGYIDKDGKKITPAIYSDGSSFNDGYAFVKYNGLYGFIDKDGKVVIDYQFEGGSNFYRGLAYVKKENHWEYINTKGKKVF